MTLHGYDYVIKFYRLQINANKIQFHKSTSTTWILLSLNGKPNNHFHNFQTINNRCYTTITWTVAFHKYDLNFSSRSIMLFVVT